MISAQPPPGLLVAVVGMVREARILRRAAVTAIVVGGGRAAELEAGLERAIAEGASAVLSFGLCGALQGALRPGDLLIASSVADDERRFPADAAWADKLAASVPEARRAVLAGADSFVVDAVAKASLAQAAGAAAVDTESHIAARLAARHRLPFAALRAVSDGASRALPAAAQVGLGGDGRPDLAAVLRSLAADPRQLPALIRTALEAEAGFRALRRCANGASLIP
ncbi:MAG TPA: hypothetical protein VII63_12655 [Caulobacteraceae bacterium]